MNTVIVIVIIPKKNMHVDVLDNIDWENTGKYKLNDSKYYNSMLHVSVFMYTLQNYSTIRLQYH